MTTKYELRAYFAKASTSVTNFGLPKSLGFV